MTTSKDWIAELRGRLREVEPDALQAELADEGAPRVLDVRELEEWEAGFIPGAEHMARGFLELRVERSVPDRSQPLVLYCAGGVRSLFATEALARMGSADVRSLRGGFTEWKQGGEADRA